MKFKTLTREEYEKMSPEEQKIIRQQMEAAQKQQAAIERQDQMVTVMTWELVKEEVARLSPGSLDEGDLKDIFESCFMIANKYISFTEQKKKEAQENVEEAEPAI